MVANRRASDERGKILSVDSRPVRDIGGAIGQSFDIDGLKKLGVVDENGELKEDIDARQIITSDGRIEIEIGDVEDLSVSSD